MLFSEHTSEWKPIQPWMEFLLKFGFGWRREQGGPRRIALVSMPCDSPAAGLIILGAMIRDLDIDSTNDLAEHSRRLVNYAENYLRKCKPCQLDQCNPEAAKCGLTTKLTGKLRSTVYPGKIFEIKKLSGDPESPFWILQKSGGGNDAPPVDRHHRYYVEGDPEPQTDQPEGHLPEAPYRGLIPGSRILAENLNKTFSGLCLAGRAAGETASREICSRINFSNGAGEYSLNQLLTIHGWSDWPVSRVAFFNPRTGELDRSVATPHLVVADGDVSFLKVADRQQFLQSDLVGVIHRTIERNRLEDIGAKMIAWRQWYGADEEMLYALPAAPRGISISILRRRG